MTTFLFTLTLLTAPDPTVVVDPACTHVRIADIGWTDVSAVSALTANLLRREGYGVDIENLSLPVTLMGLKNGDIDLFLGNWLPIQRTALQPYLADHSVAVAGTNLRGARFGLAVPHYMAEMGIASLADLAPHAADFNSTIYGIESGAAGNEAIRKLIDDHAYGLSDWRLVESSEQAMLAEVRQRVAAKQPVVFLAWEPHPMNKALAIDYLEDPQRLFAEGVNGAWVQTLVRGDLPAKCPDLARFFSQLTFSIEMENTLMIAMLEHDQTANDAASAYITSHPADAARWLRGVKPVTYKGDSEGTSQAITFRVPLGAWCEAGVAFIQRHFAGVLRHLSTSISAQLQAMAVLLSLIPVGISIVSVMALMFVLHRRFVLSIGAGVALALIWNLGFWHPMCETLVLVVMATFGAVAIGVPLGILSAHRAWFYSALRPLLDFMQTIPTFVYLIPTLMLFGLGLMPGLISTIVFVVPIPIRMTYFGIRNIPKELREASEAFGASPMQRLLKVELPCARGAIMQGVNQALMLALSMVVIASLVGAEGLGSPVIRALNTVNVGLGFEAGIAIVALAMVLDRAVRAKN